jgi:hypothetical protein
MNGFASTLFSGKRYAVVGLGRNGLPTALGLLAMGAEVVAWDDNPAARDGAKGLDLRDPAVGDFDFDALVLSPGIPHRLPKQVHHHRVAGAYPGTCPRARRGRRQPRAGFAVVAAAATSWGVRAGNVLLYVGANRLCTV